MQSFCDNVGTCGLIVTIRSFAIDFWNELRNKCTVVQLRHSIQTCVKSFTCSKCLPEILRNS